MSSFKETLMASSKIAQKELKSDVKKMKQSDMKNKELKSIPQKQQKSVLNHSTEKVVSMKNIAYNTVFTTLSQFLKLEPKLIEFNNGVYANALDSERKISFDVIAYLAQNFSILCCALAMDYKGCRDAFAIAIEEEMSLDEMSKSEHITKRKEMQRGDKIPCTNYMTVGITFFDDSVISVLLNRLRLSFASLEGTELEKYIDNLLTTLSDSDKVICGVIASNWAYFLRGCNHNPKFLNTVVQVIETLKTEYKISL